MVLLESLACGTPIVTTDHGAPQELVTPTTGAVGRAGDPESLADALGRALELARDPLTVKACRATAEPYDWDTGIAPLLEELYQEGRR
jgi:glycosyltransferase involved in cell wall biosynthesis